MLPTIMLREMKDFVSILIEKCFVTEKRWWWKREKVKIWNWNRCVFFSLEQSTARKCNPYSALAILLVYLLFHYYHSEDIKRFFSSFSNNGTNSSVTNDEMPTHINRAPTSMDHRIASGAARTAGATNHALHHNGEFLHSIMLLIVLCLLLVILFTKKFPLKFRQAIGFAKRLWSNGMINRGWSASRK